MAEATRAYLKAVLQRLDHCVAGVLDDTKLTEVSDALRQLDYNGDATLDHAVHQLNHYIADADIRARDTQHGAMQREALRRIANEIRDSHRQYID